jgi:hypothetical protein
VVTNIAMAGVLGGDARVVSVRDLPPRGKPPTTAQEQWHALGPTRTREREGL